MKTVKHILFLIGVFCCSHAATASIEGAKTPANFFDGKVMLIEEHVKFNESIFRDSSENETHTKYKVFMFGENQHALVYFSAFNPEKGKNEEYMRDIYVYENDVYCLEGLGGEILQVRDVDDFDYFSAMRLKRMFFSVFSKAKGLETSSIEVTREKPDNSLLLSWEEDSVFNLLTLDSSNGMPVEYEKRISNGDLNSLMKISYPNNGIKIIATYFAGKKDSSAPDAYLFENTLTIEFAQDEEFAKNSKPEKLGYKIVHDKRGGKERKYAIIDKLPSKEFLDELFENPDDVARYNTEMHRLAHPSPSIHKDVE